MMCDGVSLRSVSHPRPPLWKRPFLLLVRCWSTLTWPFRKHRVVETTEIELKNSDRGLRIK